MSEPGLCGTCAECRRVHTGRSTFYLCERSRIDPGFRRYPVIPVRRCGGYVPAVSPIVAALDGLAGEEEVP